MTTHILDYQVQDNSILLIDAIDIPCWLEHDQRLSWDERVERDRAIGRSIDAKRIQDIECLRQWWSRVQKNPAIAAPGYAVARVFRRLSWIIFVAGLVSGAALASAVLRYDGSEPVNVLLVLGLLVLLPAIFLIVSLILPFAASTSFAGETNLGAMVLNFLKRKSLLTDPFFATTETNAQKDKLLRWRIMMTSQLFGIAFSLAALCIALLRVSFSDLAFGWSTTLALGGDALSHVLRILATPWAQWLPQAVPSLSLIEQSHFYRLEGTSRELSPAVLATWWMFIALCLVVYGVLLRALALLGSTIGYRHATRSYLLGHREVVALLDRLRTPEVSSGADTTELAEHSNAGDARPFELAAAAGLTIVWNGAIAPAADAKLAERVDAGGERSLDDDLAAIASLKPPSNGIVQLLTKAWEPPLLDLHDYITALRASLGESVSIVVRPLGPNGSAAEERDIAIWRRSIGRLNDQEVYVA